MANKSKANPKALMPKGYEIDNKLTFEMNNKKASVVSPVQFRNEIIESQKRISYHNEFGRLQGATKMIGLQPNVKERMKELHNKARQPRKTETHAIYKARFYFLLGNIWNMKSYQKRKNL